MAENRSYDVLVLGGGPAGATCARLLSRHGHRVALLVRPRPPEQAIAESLPPSCRPLFRHVGIEAALDATDFPRSTGNTVWWGGDERVELFDGGETGWQAPAAELEELLLELASEQGTRLIRPCKVLAVSAPQMGGEPHRAPSAAPASRVRALISDDEAELEAAWVVDASGRAGLLARQGRRSSRTGTRTLALGSTWARDEPWPLPDPSHTVVESYRDGWAWSVPMVGNRRFVTMMADPRHTRLEAAGAPARLYAAELAKTSAVRRLVAQARECGPLVVCDASTYTAHRFCGPGWFLAGDAGSFLDPLSSFGVKKAVSSGWLAAVCLHTALTHPERTSAALDLYERREREIFETYEGLSRRYFGAGATASGQADVAGFWAARSRLDGEALEATSTGVDVDSLRGDAEVLAAFESIKSRPTLAVAPDPHLRLEARPMVEADEVVLRPHVIASWCPEGVRYLRDVDLPQLVSLAPDHRSVPDLFEAYLASRPQVELPDFLGALSTCLARGLLRWRTTL
jgi:2-polyprenyl-6-methoxyphenol hydroxylase-like FAD-dependent oxidoreductase